MITLKKEQLCSFEKCEEFLKAFDLTYGVLARVQERKDIKVTFNDIINGPVLLNVNTSDMFVRITADSARRFIFPRMVTSNKSSLLVGCRQVDFGSEENFLKISSFLFSPLSEEVENSSKYSFTITENHENKRNKANFWNRLILTYHMKYPDNIDLAVYAALIKDG